MRAAVEATTIAAIIATTLSTSTTPASTSANATSYSDRIFFGEPANPNEPTEKSLCLKEDNLQPGRRRLQGLGKFLESSQASESSFLQTV